MIKIERRYLRQPTGAADVDYSHPLSRGVVACIPSQIEVAYGFSLVPDSGLYVSTTQRGLGWDGFDGARKVETAIAQVRGPFSVAFDLFYGSATTSTQRYVAQGGAGPGGGWSVGLAGSGSSAFRLTFGGVADYSASTATLTTGNMYRIAVVVSGDGGTARYFLNGAFDSSRSVGTQNTASRGLSIGAAHNNSAWTVATLAGNVIGNITLWRRALSDAEVYQEYAAPWQFLSRRIWMPLASAAPSGFQAAWVRRSQTFIGTR